MAMSPQHARHYIVFIIITANDVLNFTSLFQILLCQPSGAERSARRHCSRSAFLPMPKGASMPCRWLATDHSHKLPTSGPRQAFGQGEVRAGQGAGNRPERTRSPPSRRLDTAHRAGHAKGIGNQHPLCARRRFRVCAMKMNGAVACHRVVSRKAFRLATPDRRPAVRGVAGWQPAGYGQPPSPEAPLTAR